MTGGEHRSRQPSRAALWMACTVAVLSLLSARTLAAERHPGLAWTTPAQMRLTAWRNEGTMPTPTAVSEPRGRQHLRGDGLLLVPVKGGDILRFAGKGVRVGIASGFGPNPDTIVWMHEEVDASGGDLRVPNYGTPRFLAMMAKPHQEGWGQVWIAARHENPMVWYRLDEAVAHFAASGATLPAAPYPAEDAAPILNWLREARENLQAPGCEALLRDYLLTRWRDESARVRPIEQPFFASTEVSVKGGQPGASLAEVDAPIHQRRLARAGQPLLIETGEADVVSVSIRVRAVGRTVVRVFEADSLTQELTIVTPLRATSAQRWSPARLVRLVAPEGKHLSVEVSRGEAAVSARGFRFQSSVLDLAGIRARRERPAPAVEPSCSGAARRLIETLFTAELSKTRGAVDALVAQAQRPEASTEQRALLLQEAVRLGATRSESQRWLTELWEATNATSRRTATVLRRAALEPVALARRQRFDALALPLLESSANGTVDGEENLALEALIGMVSRPEHDGRVAVAEAAERYAAAGARQDRWRDLSRNTWQRAAPWNNLKPLGTVTHLTRYVPVDPDEPGSALCASSGSMGVRWLELREHETIDVAGRGGSHTRVRFAADPTLSPADTTIELDGTPIVLHAGAGLNASAAVRPGIRRFKTSRRGVLARIPTEERLPCARLREAVRWAVVHDEAVFQVPLGDAMTVASIIVSEAWLDTPTTLRIRVGDAYYEAWVRRGATGAMEVPVPGGVTEVAVRAATPQLVRVRARLAPRPRPSSPTLPSPEPSAEEAALTDAQLVDRVRTATQALRAAPSDARRTEARLLRIQWLERLGYRAYARADRRRLPGNVVAPPAPRRRVRGCAVSLPPGSPVVEPLGLVPRIASLPNPEGAAAGQLRTLLEARSRGESPADTLRRLRPLAASSSTVDALLLAILAERQNELATAAAAFERIGRAHGSGAALARAATLRADLASSEQDPKHALTAYVLARDASELEESAVETLARLSKAVRWQNLSPDRSAGSAYVYTRQGLRLEASRGELVRRALLDAPDDAAVGGANGIGAIVKRFEHPTAKIEGACHALSGARESCALVIEVDGKPAPCLPGDAAPPGVTAAPVRCFVALPKNATKLRVLASAGSQAVLWARVSSVAGHQEAEDSPAETLVQWTEIDAARGFQAALLGPTVLRISARRRIGKGQHLRVAVQEIGGERRVVRRDLTLPEAASGRAFIHPSREPLTDYKTTYLTVPRSGRHRLTIGTSEGRAWVRVALARAVALPPAPPPQSPPQAGTAAVTNGTTTLRPIVYSVAWERPVYPLSLSAELRQVYDDLTDADEGTRDAYTELALHGRRRLGAQALWLRAGAFLRLREGPPTWGGRVKLLRAPSGDLPGVELGARVAYQEFESTWAAGLLGSASLYRPIVTGPTTKLAPNLTLTYRHADFDANHEPGADSDVFSIFAARRRQSLDVALPLHHRPFVDMLNSYGIEARTLPTFDGLDYVQAAAQTRVIAGSGAAPLVRLRVGASYRLASPLRRDPFLRTSVAPSVTLWQWLGRQSRLSVRGDATYFVDFPASTGAASRVAGFLMVAFDAVGGRGLVDFTPSERPFTERMEEDSPPADRDRLGKTPYWEENE